VSLRRVTCLLVIALAGCGGDDGPAPADVLRETAANMAKIRSADLGLRLVLEPEREPEAGRVGFALRGPVDLRTGRLPAARLRYTQIAGPNQGEATFVSTGREAFVEVGGKAYRLPADQTSSLASEAGSVRQGVRLPLGRWLRDPAVRDGGEVGGAETDRLSAKLDAATALRDIFGAARQAGAEQVPDISDAGADDLREAISSASIDIWSGREDRLLRRLRLRIAFRVSPPAALRERLGDVAGGRFALDVDLARVNAPVRVQAPADPRPAEELGAG
jgi:hypothetical protein